VTGGGSRQRQIDQVRDRLLFVFLEDPGEQQVKNTFYCGLSHFSRRRLSTRANSPLILLLIRCK
jgi:hypothetical protein